MPGVWGYGRWIWRASGVEINLADLFGGGGGMGGMVEWWHGWNGRNGRRIPGGMGGMGGMEAGKGEVVVSPPGFHFG